MENTSQETEEVNNNEVENPPVENTGEEVVAEAEKESAKLKAEVAEYKDKFLRLYSDFENFRRRTAKEKLEMVQSANEQLLKAILPVADDFERAEKAFNEQGKDAEGFLLIANKLRKVLEQFGVKVMEIKPGSDFNADLHEAITQVPAPDNSLKGKVVDVIEKGYMLNDKVIRYAKVIVGN